MLKKNYKGRYFETHLTIKPDVVKKSRKKLKWKMDEEHKSKKKHKEKWLKKIILILA